MIKLIYERPEIHSPYSAVTNITMEIDDERSRDELLDAFKEFLLSTGYQVNGQLVVEEYED